MLRGAAQPRDPLAGLCARRRSLRWSGLQAWKVGLGAPEPPLLERPGEAGLRARQASRLTPELQLLGRLDAELRAGMALRRIPGAGLRAGEAPRGAPGAGLQAGEALRRISGAGLRAGEAPRRIPGAGLRAGEALRRVPGAGLRAGEALRRVPGAGLRAGESLRRIPGSPLLEWLQTAVASVGADFHCFSRSCLLICPPPLFPCSPP